MELRKVVAFGLLCASACSVDLKVPANQTVRCDSDAACPDGFHCSNADLCVPSTREDSTAPTISDATYDRAAVGDGGTIQLRFTASEPLLVDPVITFTSNGTPRSFTKVSAVASDAPQYVFAYTTVGDEAEGANAVSASILDLAGNTNTVVMPSLVIDFTPPALQDGSVLLQLTPDRKTNPLDAVSAITNGTSIKLSFATQEPLDTTPTVSIGTLTMPVSKISSTVFSLDFVWNDSGLADGAYDVAVDLIDDAGNSADITLDVTTADTPQGFVIDTTPPAAVATATGGAIVLVRTPWGVLGDVSTDTQVQGLTGSTESNAHIGIYGAPSIPPCDSDTCRFSTFALATAITDSTGAFVVDLGPVDRQIAFIVAIDDAGNTSDVDPVTPGLQAQLISNAQLGIAFGEPFGLSNPNTFTEAKSFPAILGDLVDGSPNLNDILDVGDGVDTVSGGFTWTTHVIPAESSYDEGVTVLASHPRLGQVISASASGFHMRDARGFAPLTVSPAPSTGTVALGAMAYDIVNDAVVYFSSGIGGTWLWSGVRWSPVCTVDNCLASAPTARVGFVMAADPNRRVVVLIGGTSSGTDDPRSLWEWDGSHWANVCDSDCMASGPTAVGTAPAAVFDPHSNEIVVFTASSPSQTWSWNGRRWLQLCTSCSTAPSDRTGVAMAYDPARAEIVLFGGGSVTTDGCGRPTYLTDTWGWDGSAWTQKSPPSSTPGSYIGRNMTYDQRRKHLALMGGETVNCGAPGTPEPNGRWEWDGTRWSQPASVGQPSLMALGYDPMSKRTYGYDSTTAYAFNGLEWSLAPVPALPGWPGALVRTAYDATGALIFFNGSTTFVLAGPTWAVMCSGAASCNLPNLPWSGFALASDGSGATIAGGTDSTPSNITGAWKLSGSSWASICTGCGAHDGATMSFGGTAGEFYSMAAFADAGELVLFSGGTAQPVTPLPQSGSEVESTSMYDPLRRSLAWVGGGVPGAHGSISPRPAAEYYTQGTWNIPPLSATSEPAPLSITSGLSTFDDGLQAMVTGSSTVTQTYAGSGDRPAHYLRLALESAVALAPGTIAAIDVDWYGTATSEVAAATTDEVAIWIWDVDHWVDTGATRLAGTSHWQAHVDASLFGAGARIDRIIVGTSGTVTLAVTPAGINGGLLDLASLSTDAVTARVSYLAH